MITFPFSKKRTPKVLSGAILVITQFAGLTINQNQPTFVWNVYGPPLLCRKVKDLKEVKHLGQIPDGAILVTDVADVLGLHPSTPHKAGLETLMRRFNECEMPEITTEDIVQMAEFVLKNIFF